MPAKSRRMGSDNDLVRSYCLTRKCYSSVVVVCRVFPTNWFGDCGACAQRRARWITASSLSTASLPVRSICPQVHGLKNDIPVAGMLDLFLKPMSLLFAIASHTRPTAIDARVRYDAHGRFAVMVDAEAIRRIACRPF